MRLLLIPVLLAGTALASGCTPSTSADAPSAAPAPAPAPAAKPQLGSFGFDVAGMDRSVAAGDDFYAFSNGTWAKNTPIPADKSNYGMFTALDDLSKERVRGILDEVKDDQASMVGRAYTSYLDTATVEARGLAPIQPWLGKIKALDSKAGYAALVVEGAKMGVPGPFGGYVGQDDKIPTQYIFSIYQGGTGLPDRDMYLLDNPKMAAIRTAYLGYLTKMLTLAGEGDAETRAKAILALETSIAKVQWTREDSGDATKTYNKFTLAETAKLSSKTLDMPAVLKALSPKITEVLVGQPSAVSGIAKIIDDAPLAVVRDQMLVRSLGAMADYLPDAVADTNFAFYGTTLQGTPQREARWKRGVSFTEGTLGEELGKEYAARYFPPEYKAEMNKLVANVLDAMGRRIDSLDWMQPQTKERAKAKLKNFRQGRLPRPVAQLYGT